MNWKEQFKNREIDIIFERTPYKSFKYGLELGAGAGLQTKSLSNYCNHFTCTEYKTRFNIVELKSNSNGTDNIEYVKCDAELIDMVLEKNKYDLIFSSNMMEHLPNSGAALKGISNILADDGISIQTMPSVFMKIIYLILFYPAVIPTYLKKIFSKDDIKTAKNSINGAATISSSEKYQHDNNPKYDIDRKENIFSKYLIPKPHGASVSNVQELLSWRKKNWIKKHTQNNMIIVNVIKLPVTTGYSFKLQNICDFLYKLGLSSSYAYISVKNTSSAKAKYFRNL